MDAGGGAGVSQVPFEEEVSSIKNEMEVTKRLLTKLQVANEESKAIRDAAVMKALRDRIDYEVREFSRAAKSINGKLEQLTKDSSPDQARTSIVISLRKKLEDMRMAVDSIVEGDIQGVDAAAAESSTQGHGPIIQLEGVPHRFTYSELSVATGGFAEESKLGRGGFGSVYQGILPSGVRVAVKQMNHSSAQSQGVKEFQSEVFIINQLRHRNLIEILGWCEDFAKKEYMLVYELMPNGSLDNSLFNEAPEGTRSSLSWPQRFKIVSGTAAALDYLHQGCKRQVIHRDIKASNIMLDEEWNPKLGDFGIARLVDDQGEASTRNMAGTIGYIPPEVFSEGRFTDKADVFAFGVVLLEVACGRRVLPREFQETGLVIWVRQCLSKGELLSTVDKRLIDYDMQQMKMVLMIGLACCHSNPRERPSMSHVVQMLAGNAQDQLAKMIERIEQQEGLPPSNSTKSDQENGNHSGKKVWWQPFKSSGDHTGPKILGSSPRPGDNLGVKKTGWLPLRKEDPNRQLDGTALKIPEKFNYKQLYAATGKFSDKSKIGDGWLGSVYRGELMPGILVAVKKADSLRRVQDVNAIMVQLSLLNKLKHPNVIQLLGWCEYGSKTKKKYLLVYELMHNGSLESVMFEKMVCPSWEQRFKLVTGIATSLNYLHEGWEKKVVHRNVTNSSILVDEEWNGKLGSFGFACVGDDDGGEVGFVGTLGFITPEQIAHGPVAEKADVYAFGIVVLEVACGRKAVVNGLAPEEVFLLSWVRHNLIAGDLHKVVDKRSGNYETSWIEMLLLVGLLCSQDNYRSRPSMGQILQMLAGDVKIPSVLEMQQKFGSIKSISASYSGSDSDSD